MKQALRKLRKSAARSGKMSLSWAVKLRGLRRKMKFLFIVGHMRSGSSLLTHLLNSNPQIVGYGETGFAYPQLADLDRLIVEVMWNMRRMSLHETYVMDKLLHDRNQLGVEVTAAPCMRFLFLLREPNSTVRSIVRLGEFNPDLDYVDPQRATEYYVTRLEQLTEYAKQIDDPSRAAFLTHDQLLNSTPAAFQMLEGFLKLRSSLSEDYQVLPTTGKIGIGDPSDSIKAGRIRRDVSNASAVLLPEDLQTVAEQAYRVACQKLRSYCQSPIESPLDASSDSAGVGVGDGPASSTI